MATPYIAIMGAGFQPSSSNLQLTERLVEELIAQNVGIAVGNLTGVFEVAIQVADKHGAKSMAIIDDSMTSLPIPQSTKVQVVDKIDKHNSIADLVQAGVIIGGGPGTLKLASEILKLGKPLVALAGTGGVVEDGTLPVEVSVVETVAEAIQVL